VRAPLEVSTLAGASCATPGGGQQVAAHATKCSGARDACYLGACDDGVQALADLLGWGDDLRRLHQEGSRAASG
jgi:hypothetical protein